MEGVVLDGKLEHLARGVRDEHIWLKRYFVLHKDEAGENAKLEWSENKQSFRSSSDLRKSIDISSIHSIGASAEKDKPFAFRVYSTDRKEHPFIFAADSKETLDLWIKNLQMMVQTANPVRYVVGPSQRAQPDYLAYEPLGEIIHDARPVRTEASERSALVEGGPYALVVTATHLLLRESSAKANTTLLTWQYKHIRRYGRSRSTFTLEAGRKCPGGEGLFTFKVDNGEQVFNEVQERTRAMKNQSSTRAPGSRTSPSVTPPNEPSSPGSPPDGDQPTLPVRNYGSNPFSGNTLDTASTPPALVPRSPMSKDKNHHNKIFKAISHGASKLRDSMEDLTKIKRNSNGHDDVDGGCMGSYRVSPLSTPSPLNTPSPNVTKRLLPAIPKDSAPYIPSAAAADISLPSGENIYEEASNTTNQLVSPGSQPHYDIYDRTHAQNQPHPDDPDRCHSSPADLARQVPLRRESCDNSDAHYASVCEVASGPPLISHPLTDDYALPAEVLSLPVGKVSSVLGKIQNNNSTSNGNKEDVFTASEEYGCLDLLNHQARPYSEPAGQTDNTMNKPTEQIYGRLSAGEDSIRLPAKPKPNKRK